MLVGRGAEQAALAALLEAARSGPGGVLVIQGDPGIGKSALLAWAEEQAGGMLVIPVRGTETEGQVAYAGLFDVLRPLLGGLKQLPSAQADALGSALGLEPTRRLHRLSVYGAALALLVTAAEDVPLLVSIDDVELLDVASQQALAFVLRRSADASVACLLTLGADARGPLAEAPLPRSHLRGLPSEAAAQLLRSAVDVPVTEHVAQALVTASAGNPLALRSFRELLSNRQLAGEGPLPDPLPVAQSIEDALSRRLDSLAPDAREALLLLAAADPGDLVAVRAAAEELGVGSGWASDAARAGLISHRDGSFVHPLVRLVVLGRAQPPAIRQAHALLARHVSHPEGRIWHNAAALEGPDERVAGRLASVAITAFERGAPAVASQAFERAARLTPDSEARSARLLRSAAMAHAANMLEKAVALAEEVIRDGAATGPAVASARELRAHVLMFSGRSVEVAREAASAADSLAPRDPLQAAALYAFAALVEIIHGATAVGLALAARARQLAPRDGSRLDFMTGGAHAFLLTLSGRAEEADAEIEAWPPLPGPTDDPTAAFDLLAAVECLTFLGRTQQAQEVAKTFVERARGAGDLAALQYALGARAFGEYRRGEWLASFADASEALRLASVAPRMARAVVAYRIGSVEAGFGHFDAAERELDEALAISRLYRIPSVEIPALGGLGLLELARDRPREAIDHLARADEASRLAGVAPGVFRYSADLLDAAVHAGLEQVAVDHLSYLKGFTVGQAWVRGSIARGAGSLSGDAEAAPHLERAVEEYAAAESPFDEARTLLDHGVRLRRLRRPRDAQATIARSVAVFERLRAAPWLEKAGRELAKAGGVRRSGGESRENLSPAELQVAIVVARGATNREAAAELFLSPKTVDHHLSAVYSKLGLRSRTELAHLMATASGPGPGVSPSA